MLPPSSRLRAVTARSPLVNCRAHGAAPGAPRRRSRRAHSVLQDRERTRRPPAGTAAPAGNEDDDHHDDGRDDAPEQHHVQQPAAEAPAMVHPEPVSAVPHECPSQGPNRVTIARSQPGRARNARRFAVAARARVNLAHADARRFDPRQQTPRLRPAIRFGARTRASEPPAHADDQGRALGVLALGLEQVGRVTEPVAPGHADVRRDLAPDVVAQPQPDGEPVEALPYPARLGLVAGKARLAARLEHSALGESQCRYDRGLRWMPVYRRRRRRR